MNTFDTYKVVYDNVICYCRIKKEANKKVKKIVATGIPLLSIHILKKLTIPKKH